MPHARRTPRGGLFSGTVRATHARMAGVDPPFLAEGTDEGRGQPLAWRVGVNPICIPYPPGVARARLTRKRALVGAVRASV